MKYLQVCTESCYRRDARNEGNERNGHTDDTDGTDFLRSHRNEGRFSSTARRGKSNKRNGHTDDTDGTDGASGQQKLLSGSHNNNGM